MTMSELIERVRWLHLGTSVLLDQRRGAISSGEVQTLDDELGELLGELERMKLMGEGVVSG